MPYLREIQQLGIRLKKISLDNFRGFGFLKMDFNSSEPITVLIADNGGGKTSVLDAIAEFLRYFLEIGIKGDDYDESQLKNRTKDIFNDRTTALCKATFELNYPFPYTALFRFIEETTELLNEQQILGETAWLALDPTYSDNDPIWVLRIKNSTKASDLLLPEDFQNQIKELVDRGYKKTLMNEDFQTSIFKNNTWEPTIKMKEEDYTSINDFRGEIMLTYELGESGGRFVSSSLKNENHTLESIIKSFKDQIGFIEDFSKITRDHNPSKERYSTLPLLAYYGGSAIQTKTGEVSILYRTQPWQAYKDALSPDRFDFEEFLEWFQSLREDPPHIIKRITNAILEALNSDQKWYSNLRIEKGVFKLDKQTEEKGQASSVEIDQLSAGEKNIFALIGDLVKRAIQLNPLLFEVDFDPNIGSYSDPLLYTNGIVLIDEVDLHLHPKWQRKIIPILRDLFPNVQFLVTTHSPFVLQAVPPAQRIRLNNGKPEYFNNEPVSDYEATVIDYFHISDFFDTETEEMLTKFRRLLEEVANNKRDRKDVDFVETIKLLSEKGDTIKRVIAFELAQLHNNTI